MSAVGARESCGVVCSRRYRFAVVRYRFAFVDIAVRIRFDSRFDSCQHPCGAWTLIELASEMRENTVPRREVKGM